MGVRKNQLVGKILSDENMNLAWEQVLKNKSAPGEDGVTLARWERNWEMNLDRLREQVRMNIYRPNRPKRFRVMKKNGGFRELSILTVSDRVMQRAVLNVVNEYFELRFLPCSHGYRENRSVATAVQQVVNNREKGLRWVFDADISSCFDSIDHQILMSLVRRVIKDWFVLNLMELWLKAGRKHTNRAVGIPMGAVISPLWCNIYLHQLDAYLTCQKYKLVRYADDFIVQTRKKDQVEEAMQITASRLANLKLNLNLEKTRLSSFGDGFAFLGVHFHKNKFSYIYKEKKIEVSGKQVGVLYRNMPDFYGSRRK